MKALTLQFFNNVDANIFRLIETAAYQKMIDDGTYPLEEMQRDTLWNIVLTATVWSYGAVLNK
jgi:hypothetical protein